MSDTLPGAGRFLRRVLVAAVFLLLAPLLAAAGEVTIPQYLPLSTVNLSTGASVNVQSLPQASSLDAIGVTAMRSAYPWITGAGQTVAIIDTGMDYTHPALASRYLTGHDFVAGTSDPMDNNPDTGGHGTHVAGIIASTDPTYGGVAPGAMIAPLKVFGSSGDSASDASIISALNWVNDHAAEYHITTVNISLGDSMSDTMGWTHSDPDPASAYESILKTLKSKGIFIACAAGNDGYIGGWNQPGGLAYPAASPSVVSVGGTWASSAWSDWMYYWKDPYSWWTYSNGTFTASPATMADYAPRQDDIMVLTNRYRDGDDKGPNLMAPGAIITSSIPLAMDTDDGNQDGFTGYLGTSMASPHVAGAAVLVRQALELTGKLDPDPNMQVDQILWILQHTGKELDDWFHDPIDHLTGGNHDNIVQVPADSNNFYSNWYVRPGCGYESETFSRIDVNAAIELVYSDAYVPEPACILVLSLGACLLKRRALGRPR